MKGIALVQPNRLNADRQAPPIVVEETMIDHHNFGPGRSLKPEAGNGQLEFQYTALSFIQPERIRFKYMLEGFDKDWTNAGTRRVAYYTNIPPGSYRFLVMAKSAAGVWSQKAAAVQLDLPKHFYQTTWFNSLEGLVIVLLLGAAYEIRVKQLRANESKLLALVEARTQELSGSERKFRQLAENIHEVFWMMDPQTGALEYVSPAFDQLWGFSAEVVLKNPAAWFNPVHPEDRAGVEVFRACQRNGELLECEYRVIHHNHTYWVWDRSFPIFNQNGRLDRIVGVVEDITATNEPNKYCAVLTMIWKSASANARSNYST